MQKRSPLCFRTWVEVDASSLAANFKTVRRFIDTRTKILVVVKANAYGHGIEEVGRFASKLGADYLGVDSLEEARALHHSGVSKPILIMGYTPVPRLVEVVRFGFRQVLYSDEVLRALGNISKRLKKPARVHIKIETGTSRQGISPEVLPIFLANLSKYPGISVEGVYTHFADTENPKSSYWKVQYARFRMAQALIRRAVGERIIFHTASSAAIFLYPETHMDMVRLGVSFYGVWPSDEVKKASRRRRLTLIPALTWKTRIAQVKTVVRGAPIGYDLTERVRRDSLIAVLPVGYYDGYDRRLSSKGYVLVQGVRAKVLGRICMNMMMVDVTDVPRARSGDEVILVGCSGKECVDSEEMARISSSIPHEVLARINSYIPRMIT